MKAKKHRNFDDTVGKSLRCYSQNIRPESNRSWNVIKPPKCCGTCSYIYIYIHLICETDTVQPKSSSSCRLICYLIYHYDIWKVRHKWDSNPRSQCPTYPSTIALHVQRLRPLGHRAMRANSNLFHLFSHVLVIDATASLLRLKWVILCGSLWEIASMNNYV